MQAGRSSAQPGSSGILGRARASGGQRLENVPAGSEGAVIKTAVDGHAGKGRRWPGAPAKRRRRRPGASGAAPALYHPSDSSDSLAAWTATCSTTATTSTCCGATSPTSRSTSSTLTRRSTATPPTTCSSPSTTASRPPAKSRRSRIPGRWDQDAAARATARRSQAGGEVADALQAFHTLLGESNMMAYLAMMAPRLVELRRVLKPTGSIYLHCDPTASHYLKLLYGRRVRARSFRNEIVWKRSSAHSDTKQGRPQLRTDPRHHPLLYQGGRRGRGTRRTCPTTTTYVNQFYRHVEPGTGRRYRLDNLTAGKRGEGKPPTSGRADGKAYHTYSGRSGLLDGEAWKSSTGKAASSRRRRDVRRPKRYLDEMPGVPLQDVWADISRIWRQLDRAARLPDAEARGSSGAHHPSAAATKATWCSTRSAAAARRSRWPSGSTAAGSASTSPTWPSTSSSTVCVTAFGESIKSQVQGGRRAGRRAGRTQLAQR